MCDLYTFISNNLGFTLGRIHLGLETEPTDSAVLSFPVPSIRRCLDINIR